jgi:RHS repeat-associated protein
MIRKQADEFQRRQLRASTAWTPRRNGGAYTNDANGNTLTGGGRTNTWDGQNRLTQCVFGGTTTSHTYGADGLRRRTVQGATTTDYVLMGDSVVRTLVNGALDKTMLHGPRGPEYERTGGGAPVWYLYDGLGSVLGTVDAAGNVVHTRKYDVYGAVRASTGGAGPKHRWVGSLGHPSEDETGLVYMRARYYDPVVGRFASEDPAEHGPNWFQLCGRGSDFSRGLRRARVGVAVQSGSPVGAVRPQADDDGGDGPRAHARVVHQRPRQEGEPAARDGLQRARRGDRPGATRDGQRRRRRRPHGHRSPTASLGVAATAGLRWW